MKCIKCNKPAVYDLCPQGEPRLGERGLCYDCLNEVPKGLKRTESHGKCPMCGSDALDGGYFDEFPDEPCDFYMDILCTRCGLSFLEVYKYSYSIYVKPTVKN